MEKEKIEKVASNELRQDLSNGLKNICYEKRLTPTEILNESSLSLAFLGDAVWSMLVRTYFCERTTFKNNYLHRFTTQFVKASYQANALDKLSSTLSQEEKDVARRARNAKLNTVSKNASLCDYKKATSFEALLGYHYLLHNFDRIQEIFEFSKPDMEQVLTLKIKK